MTTAPQVQSSKVQWDGALMGHHQFGRSALATAAVDNIGTFTAPCDLTIVKFLLTVLASTTSSNAKVSIGTAAASGAYRGELSIASKAAGTLIDDDVTVATGKWTKITMAKGAQLKLKTKAATAAGSFCASLVFVPTAAAA